ncbi:MAG: STN and carboxypeptidase regulatory-like domain-containing protein [Bacteroidota bacterium]
MAKAIRFFVFSIILIIAGNSYSQNALQKKVSFALTNQPVEKVLAKMAQSGGISFSYNSDLIPLDSIVSINFKNSSISKSLYILLGRDFFYKTIGNHIVILKKQKEKIEKSKKIVCTFSGVIKNHTTNEVIIGATIYDLNKNYSALSDSTGFFKFSFIPETEFVGFSFSKEGFNDTLVFIKYKSNTTIDITLFPKKKPEEIIEKIKPKEINQIPPFNINDYKIVKTFVKPDMLLHANNLLLPDKRTFQFSILPTIGTNRSVSGAMINKISFNTIAGYSNGVEGVELGTINITKQNVEGFQFAGLGNVTGGYTKGFQAAGIFNRNAGNVSGFQLSGLSNIILDTLKGLQIGCFNYVKTNRGLQLGFINLADSSDGLSIGVLTIVKKGYFNASLFIDEMLMPNAVFKMGTHKFYNIWGLSASQEMWGLTYGVGFHRNQERKLSLNYDLSFTNMSFKKTFETQICMKVKLSADINYRINQRFDLFAGLSYNMFASDKIIDLALQNYIDKTSNSKVNSFDFRSVRMQHWPGALLGLKYRI